MDQDDLIKKNQCYFDGSLNIQENGTILSDIKEEMDPMPVYYGQIKDDRDPLDNCDIDENQENSNTAETVNKTHLLKDIESVHEGIKPIKCSICTFETGNKTNLKIHIDSVHEGIKPFKCTLCDYKAARNFNLKHHIETVHQGIKAFKCNICGIEITQKSGLKRHISSVHKGIKPFKCNFCDYETAQKATLKKHIKAVHEGIKPFMCNICNYKTSKNYYLKKHIESVHEGIKPFKCNICGLETAQKSTLKKHIESVHEGMKPYKRKICDFETATNSDLKRHIDSIHEGIKSFKCHICQFESATKSYLKQHITSVHEDKKNESLKNESKNNESKDIYNKYAQTTLNVANISKNAKEIQTSTQTLNIDKRCLVPDAFIMKEEPNFEEASSESEMSSVTDKGMSKPKMSYARLISETLLNSPNGMLVLSDIYGSISARHPYYKMNVTGWQNSIRHNLTLNQSFVKCTDSLSTGKYSNYWKLSKNLSKSVMKNLSKEELSKIQASLGISNAVAKKEKGKNCYVKSKTSFHPLCQECNQTFVNKDQLNVHSCLAIKQEPKEIKGSVIEGSENYQKVGFQSIKVEPLTTELTQMSDIVDPLLMHVIKKEHFEENEATPFQDLTEVYIKQEEFCENERGNGMIVQEIKEEFVLGESKNYIL